MVRRLLVEGVLRWWGGLMLWVEMVCFVFLWVPASAGMTDGLREWRGTKVFGVFLWRNSGIPLLAALASPFAARRGGRYWGGFRAFLACCAWLARVFFAERRGGLPPVSVARVDVRCRARIVLRSSQAGG